MTPTVLIAGGGTGGHLIPALVIGEAIQKRHPEYRVVLVGAQRGIEAALLPHRQFEYHLLPFEPIYRRQWWKNVRWGVLGFRLVREVGRLLDALDPRVVIGTGGYASGPVVWRAARRGIPTAVLELNALPGLAVRRMARWVDDVWLGSPEARALLRPAPKTRIVDTGAPIAPPDPSVRDSARASFGLEADTPVMLVSGGSQGAHALNEAIGRWIERGSAGRVQLLWVTGKGGYSEFARYHKPPGVRVVDFLDPMQLGYAVADFAVTRAGMMTIAELCAWGIPSVLVPLPSAAADHQTANARAMEEAGASLVLDQAELGPETIAAAVDRLLDDPEKLSQMRSAALRRAKPDALDRILDRFGILSG